MALPVLLAPVVSWIFRDVVVKFVVFTAVFALVAVLVPVALGYLGPYLGTQNLTAAFSNLSPGIWYFLDLFEIGVGVPVVISAAITRFLIRRLPVIG